jgi:hypothetical protein
VLELDRLSLFGSYTSHVHETRAVGACDVFRTSLDMSLNLVETHLGRDCRFFYGEHATEAATLVRTLWFHNVDSIDKRKKIPYLVEADNMLFSG